MALTQEQGAEQLVSRARNGDQNAMGMIAEVAKMAQHGSAKAKNAYALLKDYIEKHPVKNTANIGGDITKILKEIKAPCEDPKLLSSLQKLPKLGNMIAIHGASVILSEKEPWSAERVQTLIGCLPTEGAKQLFNCGYQFSGQPIRITQATKAIPELEAIGAIFSGHCIGMARKLQLMKNGKVNASIISPEIGWELGC